MNCCNDVQRTDDREHRVCVCVIQWQKKRKFQNRFTGKSNVTRLWSRLFIFCRVSLPINQCQRLNISHTLTHTSLMNPFACEEQKEELKKTQGVASCDDEIQHLSSCILRVCIDWRLLRCSCVMWFHSFANTHNASHTHTNRMTMIVVCLHGGKHMNIRICRSNLTSIHEPHTINSMMMLMHAFACESCCSFKFVTKCFYWTCLIPIRPGERDGEMAIEW